MAELTQNYEYLVNQVNQIQAAQEDCELSRIEKSLEAKTEK